MIDFKHGDRVYHRFLKKHGTVVVHDSLDTDPTSVCVQFDSETIRGARINPDISEVSKACLELETSNLLRDAANIAAKAAADFVGHGQREKYIDIMKIGIRAAVEAGIIALQPTREAAEK